jgi:hypothetical protein
MIEPGTYNIVAPQGATFDRTFTFRIDGSLVNLTGYTAAMKVRAKASSDAVLSLTNASGITLGGAAGTIVLGITATQMAAIAPGSYLYDLELTQAGTVTRLIQGSFTVSAEITYA